MWVKKANVSESLMTRRNGTDDIKTGVEPDPWDEPGGCLPIGQAASGVEAARAWSGLRCGTCEPVVPDSRAASGAVFVCGRCALARTPSSRSVRGESNDAGHRRGPLQLEDGTLRLGDRGSPQGGLCAAAHNPPNGKRRGMFSDRRMLLVVGVATAERCA